MYEIKPYQPIDLSACLQVFKDNVPAFFAVNEESDFIDFLGNITGNYFVMTTASHNASDVVVGCFGLTEIKPANSARLSWIMLSPSKQGKGAGQQMMQYCIKQAKELNLQYIHIAASHLSAPFFEKYGATAIDFIEHGWGENMHRINMVQAVKTCE